MRVAAAVLAITMAATATVSCQRPAPPPPTVPAARPVPPMPAVGAVFLGGTDTHTCTGAVVHSAPGDLVLTAAHCLEAQYPATFVPGFDGHNGPADVWHIDTVYLDPRWVTSQDPAADYAFARVSRPAWACGSSTSTQVSASVNARSGRPAGSMVFGSKLNRLMPIWRV